MKLLVLDGNSILNRAFYGVRPLTTKDGQPTNAIYGFLTMLHKIRRDVHPDGMAIAFDMRAPTFRHKKYAEYKGKRKGMPDELAAQLDPLKSILTAMGYKLVTAEGWEADDIIGTLAKVCTEQGSPCVIATGDRDTLQLISPSVSVRLLTTKSGRPEATTYDEAAVMENYGVTPPQLIDIKAIQGDTSDNIPGVPGIGEKGAGELIRAFGSLDGVYEHLDDPSVKAGTRAKLEAGKESAYLSYWLGTVASDAPVSLKLDDYMIAPPDAAAVRSQMVALELFSLLEKMELPSAPAAVKPSGFTAEKSVSVRFASLDEAVRVAEEECKADLVYTCDAQLAPTFAALCGQDETLLLPAEDAPAFLVKICGDDRIAIRTHDVKKLWHMVKKIDETAAINNIVFDTMLAAYLCNPSGTDFSLERIAAQYTKSDDSLPPFLAQAGDAVRFRATADALEKAVDDAGLRPLLRDVELPLAIVLANMEATGIEADGDGLREFGKILDEKIHELEHMAHAEAGHEFNLNSPKQVGEILFGQLLLPGGKRTKTGYSTSAEVLEGLRGAHPLVDIILEHRTLQKLSSTYCVGLHEAIADDGRIHTSFNQTETRTGRISSTEPNLQNIPVRTELGAELRRFFRARDGWILVDADYSQIELRVLAHMASDPVMISGFLGGEDIHRITASQVFGVPHEEVTPVMRSRAKAVNFGIVYGISAFSLAKDIGVSQGEAKAYIDEYLNHYVNIAKFMKSMIALAKAKGYAETLWSRRRYLPELAASNFNLRSFGERVARNMPIQGTAADIIKIAMVRVHARLEAEGLRSRLIMQVHDELIIEAPEDEAAAASVILREEMERAAELSVPLVVDVHTGKTWRDAK